MLRSKISRVTMRFAALLSVCAPLVSCSHDELFGPGGGVTVTVSTPSAVQTGDIRITFTLSDDDETRADISVKFATDGVSFQTASRATGSVGTSGLAVSVGGTAHTFIWDSARDIDDARLDGVVLRIQVDGGTTDASGGFTVHNGRFLLVSHDRTTAQVSLYLLDAIDADLQFLQTLSPGGQEPWDVLFEDGRFFVANVGTNDVTVLDLDEDTGTVSTVAGSPFDADGINSKYLATDGDHLFVSNVASGTITIFDIDADTGALDLNAHSGEAAANCRTMVVRSGRLFVANETDGEILIFDIAASGELVPNGFSPITTGGVATPVALTNVGSRLYASNYATSTVAGFNILGGGDLSAIAGSPFTFTGTLVLQVAHDDADERLFLATSGASAFASMGLDAIGVATEDASSPHTADGLTHAVASAGTVVVVGNSNSESIEAFTVSTTGATTAGDDNPVDLGDPVGRMAISD